ncbi:hypothetical protein [Sulfurisphaera tokodaii]|uniref:AAA+ ATPase domain-containing protein n=2 Tax=Sulfurisphaera tokodaii TaxID=111955 RepID=Q973P8_SULTO|nr:hypothetical protein [Sulfurisphaera tokodaii]BAB65863.1 hypothetical protein STK_08500 [Sulfurisphaera tokodaii str. 7]HII73385.1 hypothetical protein [Sulfurisphaera tokodaii]
MCNFPSYTVARYFDDNVILVGEVWDSARKSILNNIINDNGMVTTIIGSPGMGKTTILNAVVKDLKNRDDVFVIYLDLSASDRLSKAAWNYIREKLEYVRSKVFNYLSLHKKEIGYKGFLTYISKDFKNWLRHQCESSDDARIKLYCFRYKEDIEGLIEFLNDLKTSQLFKVGILIDETKSKEEILDELHELINKVKIPIAITLIPQEYNKVTNAALVRRLTENQIELKLSDKDKEEILKAYCEKYYKELLSIDEVRNAETLNALLDKARDKYEEALNECKKNGAYYIDECIKDYLQKFYPIDESKLDDYSTALEKKIREKLLEIKQQAPVIKYIHERGKKLDEYGVTVDIYFETENTIYLGDVKLSNEKELKNIKNVKKLENVQIYKDKKVVKFIVTNVNNVNLSDFTIIPVNNLSIKKIVDDNDEKERDLLVKMMLNRLGIVI